MIDVGEAAIPPVLPAASSVAEVQAPPVAVQVPDEPEPARSAVSIGEVPQRSTRAPLVVGLGLGVVLGVVGLAALWNASAALDGGHAAQQAMNSTSPHETTAAIIRRSEPVPTPPRGPDLLPAVPPVQDIKSTTEPATVQAKPARGDARVAQVRRAIYRCNPLIPYSKSTVTVEADSAGKTQIQFSGREAQGDFGRCVGEVAARTKIADGERLSFKL